MKRIIILLFLLTAAAACKSIKKSKSQSLTVTHSVAATMVQSESFRQALAQDSIEEYDETLEETTTGFVALDSAGFTVFKPQTTSVKKSRSNRSRTSTQDSLEAASSSSDQSISETVSTFLKDLDKASEASEAPEKIAGALFPSWLKILGSILTLLVPIAWGIYKKKHQIE